MKRLYHFFVNAGLKEELGSHPGWVVRFRRAEDTWTREGKLKTRMRLRKHIGVSMCTGSMPGSGYLPG
jgi:hypothetical protein